MENNKSEQIEKLKLALQKLKNKEGKFLFFVQNSVNPAASVNEIYFHATTVKKMGYDVTILTDGADYEIPDWVDAYLTNLPHQSMDKAKLSVGTQDVLVIPEIFSNVMEQTKNLPCIRVGLLQSVDYKINALLPGVDWSKDFGIKHVITTSELIIELINDFYGENAFNMYKYSPSIPDYFNYNGELKRPVISVIGRNPNEISKIVKLFYTKFPQYTWITFDSMVTESKPPKALRRVDFAERLKTNFAAVWVDRISSFGTFPLECMKANTIPIGLIPDIVPEYLFDKDNKFIENSGVWTKDIYAIPQLIGDVLTKYLDDSIDEELFKGMENVAKRYSENNSKNELIQIYKKIVNERIDLIEKAIEQEESKNKINEKVEEK